jgi:hypothetical protein
MTNTLDGPPSPTPQNKARKILGVLIMVVALLIMLLGSGGGLCAGMSIALGNVRGHEMYSYLWSALLVLLVGGGLFWAGLRMVSRK